MISRKTSSLTQKISSALILVGLVSMTACKSKLETKGDDYLEKGQYSKALQMYNKVDDKKKGSEEFADKYALAFAKKMEEEVKVNPEADIINNYSDQLQKMAPELKDKARAEQTAAAVIETAKARISTNSFVQAVNSFRLLDALAPPLSKIGINSFGDARKNMQDDIVKSALKKADNAPGPIGAEYYLTEGFYLVKDNESLNKALNSTRKKNLGNLLIWSEDASGVAPNPIVNTNGFIFAFVNGSTGLTETSLSATLLIWNSTGNNTELKANDFVVVNKEGKEIASTAKVSTKCAVKFFNERDCETPVKFSFPAGFNPILVKIKNTDGVGVKYLGNGI
jgi:hypothetical protein